MKNCPNYSSLDFKRLVNYYNGNVNEALKVYMAHGDMLPEIPSITKIKEDLKFNSGIISERARAMLLSRVKNYNNMHGTSHRIKFERLSPTSYKPKLALNFLPKYKPSAYKKSTVKTVNTVKSDTEIETVLSPSDIIVKEGNEYTVNGEVFPSYEDAYNSIIDENDDSYFQLSSTSNESIKELDSFLTEFLKKYDISVENIDNFKERFGVDGIAVADILNKVIYTANGKQSMETLPEEAAHFIVEMLGENHPLYKAMNSVIEQTSEYQEVVEEYGEVYKGNKTKLKKEAMGKVLSKYFINRFENKESLPVKTQNIFERVINWFKKFFGKIDNTSLQEKINSIFGNAANQVFDETIELDPDKLTSNELYYELDTAKKNINKAIKQLEEHVKLLERRAVSDPQEHHVKEMHSKIEDIKSLVEKEQLKKGIIGLLQNGVEYELGVLRDTMQKIKEDPSIVVSSSRVVNLQNIISTYSDIIQEIRAGINEDADLTKWASEYEGIFSTIRKDLEEGRDFVEKARIKRTKEIVEENKHPNSDYSADELLNSKVGDISGLASFVAPLHSVNDEALKMVYKVVQDIYMETKREAITKTNRLLDLQIAMEKAGHRDLSVFHEKDKDGKKTGYLITELKWGEYNQAHNDTKSAIVEELNKEGMNLNDYADVKKDELNDKQLKIYNKLWKTFHDKYTSINGEPLPPINPEFTKLMRNKEVSAYYNELRKTHLETRKMLPKLYSTPQYLYMVPQQEKDTIQILRGSKDTLSQNMRSKLKETYKFAASEEEIADNKKAYETISSERNTRMVPIYYVKRLDNMEMLSDSFSEMYGHFTEMALNFKGLNSKLDDLLLIQQAIGGRKIVDDKGNIVKTDGKLTHSYKIMESFLKQHVFKEYPQAKVKLGNKEYNFTKIIKNVLAYVRNKNLFSALFTIGAGTMKGAIDSKIEDVIGVTTTQNSKLWAEVEFNKNLGYLLKNINSRRRSTKMEMFFQHAGVFGELRNIFNRLDVDNRISRITKDQIIYGGYEVSAFKTKGKLALAVYDNYRLIDGKFIRRHEYKRDIIEKHGENAWNKRYKDVWKAARKNSLYNAFEAVNGEFVVKEEFKKYVSKGLLNTVNGMIEQRSAVVEGRLHNLERGAIHNELLGQAVTMHRGWLISGAVERFKSKGMNYETGEYEQGYYLTVKDFVVNLVKDHNANILQARAMWNKLEPWQKRNMYRMSADVAFTILAWTMFKLMQGLAEGADDDEWILQAMAYQATRIFLEQKAFMGVTEGLNMLSSPIPSINLVEDSFSFLRAFVNYEPIEYGPYKGKLELEKSIWRLSYLKNIYELQYPEVKDKYIKSQIF